MKQLCISILLAIVQIIRAQHSFGPPLVWLTSEDAKLLPNGDIYYWKFRAPPGNKLSLKVTNSSWPTIVKAAGSNLSVVLFGGDDCLAVNWNLKPLIPVNYTISLVASTTKNSQGYLFAGNHSFGYTPAITSGYHGDFEYLDSTAKKFVNQESFAGFGVAGSALHNLIVVASGSETKLYYDGVYVTRGTSSKIPWALLAVGCGQVDQHAVGSQFADLRIYKNVLNSDEVTVLYKNLADHWSLLRQKSTKSYTNSLSAGPDAHVISDASLLTICGIITVQVGIFSVLYTLCL